MRGNSRKEEKHWRSFIAEFFVYEYVSVDISAVETTEITTTHLEWANVRKLREQKTIGDTFTYLQKLREIMERIYLAYSSGRIHSTLVSADAWLQYSVNHFSISVSIWANQVELRLSYFALKETEWNIRFKVKDNIISVMCYVTTDGY